jgi:phosphatidylethanolamine-binding protein (PEBP) family uncharacterized protein
MPAVAFLLAGIILTAPFKNGGTIPKRYTCDGADARPAIGFWDAFRPGQRPVRRASALEVTDIDVPGGAFVHFIAVGRVEGRNSFGTVGWRGPCPSAGDPPHRYVFRMYVLDRRPALKTGFTDAQLRRVIRGHVVATGKIVGRYGR